MSAIRERDLLAQSLVGDYGSRDVLYKTYFEQNEAIHRYGSGYGSLDDFLHDSFINLLRRGHSFNAEERLETIVYSIALWTAVERMRLKSWPATDGSDPIRIGAPVEAEQSDGAIASYVPPRLPVDALSSRLAAIAGENQLAVLRACAREDGTWEQAANAAGKPVRSVGQAVVRTVETLSRYFGAPPPLDADLLSVLSRPGGATGRVVSINLDTVFYTATPAMRTIGVSIPSEIRTITLWNAARSSAAPSGPFADHLAQCHYCSDLLRSILRLQQAILSGAGTRFLYCPPPSTLLPHTDEISEPLTAHLADCAACHGERSQALAMEDAQAQTQGNEGKGKRRSQKTLWIAATALAVLAIAWVVYRNPKSEIQPSATTSVFTESSKPIQQVAPSPRYADLVHAVNLNDPKLLGTVAPSNQLWVTEALEKLKRRHLAEAKMTFANLMNQRNDPGARMLYAICLFGEQAFSESYDEMKKAEAIQPRHSYRCWSLLQMALRFGDKETAEREIAHLAGDRDFGPLAKIAQAKLASRQ